ncbi:MAG: hypothetical protein WC198_06495 [Victivallaceae bacterium]
MNRYAKILGSDNSDSVSNFEVTDVEIKEAAENMNSKIEVISFFDPRPDLSEDNILWSILLELANETNTQLAANLHGFRCAGTRLRRNAKWGLVMEPILPGPGVEDGVTDWRNREDYKTEAEKYLKPYHEELLGLFKKIG